MQNNFTPSVNIIRDLENDLKYFPTPNAERVIEYLNKNISKGIKSFYLVGSYGTGKSSFLLALEKQVSDEKSNTKIFKTPISFNGSTKYKSFNIIGDYKSFDEALREKLRINTKKDILNALSNLYDELHVGKKGLIIAIDEFGKFLEYASQNNPEKELYLIQKLAEFSNDPKKNILLLTTLHQGFDVYRQNLNEKVRNEWDKVRGRLVEIPFNEPVEQLLYLASEFINGKLHDIPPKSFKHLYKSIISSRIYPLNNNLNEILAERLFPLDLISGGILIKALQKYGQNERSLFTFLETQDVKKSTKKATFFNLNLVYDYLINNFYSLLSSKANPDYFKWSIIKSTIERAEILFEREAEPKIQIIKAIGLLNIFASAGAKINKRFLETYGELSLNIKNISKELSLLESKKIIRYRSYSDSYILFEGTDIDLDLSLRDAENHISKVESIAPVLKEYFDLPFIAEKATYIKKGTPRFFEYIISEEPISIKPIGEIDGFINLIFNKNISLEKVKSLSKVSEEAILFVIYNNVNRIKEILYEIDKIDFVLKNTVDDRIVQRELKGLRFSCISELNLLVVESLFEKDGGIHWIFNGEIKKVQSKNDFNELLSEIIEYIYPLTPIFKNELINREKLPAAITTARKNLFTSLLKNYSLEDLGYPPNQYPPDKTIYLSLLKKTSIHYINKDEWSWQEPKEKSFKELWHCCEEWFISCKSNKRSIIELYNILLNKPYKLKQGFVDFWIPIFLFIKREDYALFESETYIPYLSNDLISILIRRPENHYIKAFDLHGIKINLFNRYRSLLNKSSENKITNKSFIETIKPFLALYKELPEYSKKTIRLSKTAIALREAISKSRDPEKTFFDDFPYALGFSNISLYQSDENLSDFVIQLQNNIRELRNCYTELIQRVEINLLSLFDLGGIPFPEYKIKIIAKYSTIKKHLLLPKQKTFYLRLHSELNERTSWLSSIMFPLIDKNLDQISDFEEELIFDKIQDIFSELDNLCEFSNLDMDLGKEQAFRYEITPVSGYKEKGMIRITNKKIEESKVIEEDFRDLLTKDKVINQYVLLKLLKEQLKNE
jgi:hypothetical protein